jgi:D-proline reductase (dithiol) PrdB
MTGARARLAVVWSESQGALDGGEATMTTIASGATGAFAAEDDVPIPYMQRTRDYYLALGYDNPYRWAHFVEVPFTPLRAPLGRARVALITTAAPSRPEAGDQGPGAAYNAAAKFYQVYSLSTESQPDLRISHVGYDRRHTSAADINAYFPLARMKEAVAAGRIGALGPRVHGAPTNRSHQATEADAAELRRRCREDGVDAAVLVPS